MKISLIFGLCAVFSVNLVLAQSKPENCNPKSYVELVQCIEKNSANIAISEQQLKAAQELNSFARQWVNPDLDIESLSKGSEKSETTASLLFNLRLGGKRSADIGIAKAEIAKSEVIRDLSVGEARLSAMLALYRLSHLKKEIALELESGATFTKITQQYQRKSALSPEEKVSLSVFKIATADHKLGLNKLQNENDSILNQLSVLTGIDKALILKALPEVKKNWPETSKLKNTENENLSSKLAKSDLDVAQGQKDKASSEAWPDIKIGPVVKLQKDNTTGANENFAGFGLSMPLPVFTLNGGGKAYAQQKLIEAQMTYELTKKQALSKREQLLLKYEGLLAVLNSTLSEKELSDRHELVEREFFKGLVSGALVIEAHRQLFEYIEKRNQSELEAIETLGQILIQDSQFSGLVL